MRPYRHNRYLGSEHIRSQREYERERSTPTAKQKKFFISLVMRCKENNIDCTTGRTSSRAEYALAIDKLIERLKEAGVEINGNGKKAIAVLTYGTDLRGNDYRTTERIVVEEGVE